MVEAAMSDPACELETLRAELAATKAELAQARAVVSTSEAMISGLKLEIALLRRETYGHSAERTARLIDHWADCRFSRAYPATTREPAAPRLLIQLLPWLAWA